MTANQIIATAREQVGTPFRHQGRMPGKALDCAGLIVHVAATLGMDYVDSQAYGRSPANGLLESALDGQPCLVREDRQARAGDLLLMRFAREPQHLALCAGDTIIHAWQQAGHVCEHGFTGEWQSRIVRVYSFSGIES